MIKRQRKAILFVLLACMVVLVCTAQRMAGMHALVMNLAADSPSLQQTQDKADAPVTPCELSAKSLMAVPPMLFEGGCWLSPCCWRCWRRSRRVSNASGLPALSPRPDCGCICDYASSVSE